MAGFVCSRAISRLIVMTVLKMIQIIGGQGAVVVVRKPKRATDDTEDSGIQGSPFTRAETD